jgi:hypothetical protein
MKINLRYTAKFDSFIIVKVYAPLSLIGASEVDVESAAATMEADDVVAISPIVLAIIGTCICSGGIMTFGISESDGSCDDIFYF